jgi:peptide/nickel transport system permease protein
MVAISPPTAAATAAAAGAGNELVAPRSYLGEVRVRFFRKHAGVVALGTLALLVALAALAPLIAPYDPIAGSATQRLLPIGHPAHVLGTDEQGRDIISRLLWGGRVSLVTGFVPVLIATTLGTAIGATAGYVRGVLGMALMRTMDMFYAFPAIMLAIGITASLGAGAGSTMIAISVVFIPSIARVAEAATRKVYILEYIEAARLSGASTPRIIVSQLLANIFNPIFIYASGLIGLSIVIASGLSFLGMGAKPPTPEWGFMLNSLRGAIYQQPLVAILPGLLVFIVSMSCNIVSDSLRDALDIRDA